MVVLPAPRRVLYLHGFASSPFSRKATFLAGRLRALGYVVDIPALDENDFGNLTITRQLNLVRSRMDGGPISVIGSSLGGYLAALLASHHLEIDRLVLLAPAFDFFRLWTEELGPERLADWREQDALNVYHYGAGKEVALRYELMRDAAAHQPFPEFEQPALIIHGENDRVVPIALSEQYVAAHPNCRLIRFASGHELTDVLEDMYPPIENFLLDARPKFRC
jgi:hypothetical protein